MEDDFSPSWAIGPDNSSKMSQCFQKFRDFEETSLSLSKSKNWYKIDIGAYEGVIAILWL